MELECVLLDKIHFPNVSLLLYLDFEEEDKEPDKQKQDGLKKDPAPSAIHKLPLLGIGSGREAEEALFVALKKQRQALQRAAMLGNGGGAHADDMKQKQKRHGQAQQGPSAAPPPADFSGWRSEGKKWMPRVRTRRVQNH